MRFCIKQDPAHGGQDLTSNTTPVDSPQASIVRPCIVGTPDTLLCFVASYRHERASRKYTRMPVMTIYCPAPSFIILCTQPMPKGTKMSQHLICMYADTAVCGHPSPQQTKTVEDQAKRIYRDSTNIAILKRVARPPTSVHVCAYCICRYSHRLERTG
jgi:hypothetical protein